MSFDDGFMLGLSLGGGGSTPEPYLSDEGTLKAVIDDDSSNLAIVLTDNGDNDTGEQKFTVYQYTYAAKEISGSVTTKSTTTSGETTTTTTKTKSWSRYLIDKLYNKSGKVIMQAVYADESKGKVSHYLDENGRKIYLDGGYANE